MKPRETLAQTNNPKKAFAATKLGGKAVPEDASEIAVLLAAAQEIAKLQAQFPKLTPNLTEEDIFFLCDCFNRSSDSNPNLAPMCRSSLWAGWSGRGRRYG